MIKEYAYAKINLALEVMDVDNGYHLVNNLMIPINLYDVLTFEYDNEIILVDNKIDNNIILKAAKAFLSYFKINGGVRITLEKNIPIQAGLAGGSTDAASTLLGLDKLYNVNATKNQLLEIAKTLGSDVAFFIEKKLAMCTHYGEIINTIDIKYNNFKLYIIKPKSGLSTALVYKNYKYMHISKENKINNIIKGLELNNIKMVEENIFNDLENISLMLNEELKMLYNDLKEYSPHISGSGPSLFIITDKDIDFTKYKAKYPSLFVYKTETL